MVFDVALAPVAALLVDEELQRQASTRAV